ncbi:MAG: PIN domain-containing protein [Bacteroidales bacterium]|nr:PIN domain-containing protein [Bacteroidales bacterium]
MKRVFLDTNVLMDLAQFRDGFHNALDILQGAYDSRYSVCACVLSYANIAYLLRKESQERRYEILSLLADTVPMLPLTPDDMAKAIAQPVRDFEDMLQYQCAKAAGCDVIVTNNGRDFAAFCDLPLMTAAEFLLQFNLAE